MSIIGPDRGSYRAMTHSSQVMRNTRGPPRCRTSGVGPCRCGVIAITGNGETSHRLDCSGGVKWARQKEFPS